MIHAAIADFAAALPDGRGVLGLDLGTKTIGVALSDRLLSSATALETEAKSSSRISHTSIALSARSLLALLAECNPDL